MFFKKKAAGKAEPKLEDLKVDEQHTKSYHLGGNEIADDKPLPELDPISDKGGAAEAMVEETGGAEKISLTDHEAAEAAEIEAGAGDAIGIMAKNQTFTAKKQAEPSAEAEERQSRIEKTESPPPPAVSINRGDIKMNDFQTPKSQALQDIQEAGLTVEEAVAETAGEKIDESIKDKKSGRKRVENLATVARFRWYVLLFLAEISVLGWAIEAQFSGRPYLWIAWAVFTGTFLSGCLTFKFLRVPTRAGLAALGWGLSYFVSAAYGPQDLLFRNVPAALIWSGLLTLVMLWVGVAIWRKIGRYKVIDIVLSVILIYAALSPFWSLADNIMAGAALNLRFDILAASPGFITSHLPWFLWPMTVTLAFILPLAAFFSLWDQLGALRRRGARHGGDLFLALAFICLIPYGFLSFDAAVKEHPNWAMKIRAVFPFSEAAKYAREANASAVAAVETDNQGLTKPTVETAQPIIVVEVSPEIPPPPQPPAIHQDQAVMEEQPKPVEAPSGAGPEEFHESKAVETMEKSTAPDPVSSSLEQQPPSASVEKSPQEFPAAALGAADESGLEKRLKTTEDRLNQALDRIDELEKQIKEMKTEIKPDNDDQMILDHSPTAFDPEAEGELSSSLPPRTSSGKTFISPGGLPEGLTMV